MQLKPNQQETLPVTGICCIRLEITQSMLITPTTPTPLLVAEMVRMKTMKNQKLTLTDTLQSIQMPARAMTIITILGIRKFN